MDVKKKTVEYGRYGIVFLVPFFLTFAVFQFYPLLYTIADSFVYTAKNGRQTVSTVGLGNYINYIFGTAGNGEIWQALLITVALWLFNFIPQIILSLVLAAWFTDGQRKLKASGAYKAIMYLPNIITAATIAVLYFNMFDTHGPITSFLYKLNIIKSDDLLYSGWFSLGLIAFIQFWMWYGNTMVVLTAGILGINPSLYEAACVDGATSRQQFFKITLPLLKPILQYTLVTSAIGGLQMYDIPQLLNGGGPVVRFGEGSVYSTRTVVMLIKQYVSNGASQNFGRASAYSVVLFVVTLAISMIFYIATSEKKSKGR